MTRLLPVLLLLLPAFAFPAHYLETFSTPDKGYPVDFVDGFSAVNRTLSNTVRYISGSGVSSSCTTNFPAIAGSAGNTFKVEVCANDNFNAEVVTLDNGKVSGVVICPTITFTATPTNACSGSSNGQIAVTGETGGTGPYMYSKDNGVNYQSGATFTGLAAGMYNVVVKDANGCESAATQVTVGTFSPPTCIITGPLYVCSNTENIVYTAPGGMSAYSWEVSTNGSIPGSTTGSSVSVTSGNFLNDYTVTVTVTDANGCTSSCSNQSFIYLQKPPADITANPNPVCQGAILNLSINAAASSTVSWSGEGITNSSGNPSTTAIPTTTGPHVYNVMVTSNPAGCTNTGTATVTVSPPPTCSINGPSSACAGSTGNVYSAPGGLNAYSWDVSGSAAIEGLNTGSSISVTAGASGTYTVSVTLTDANGCTSTCSQPVTINALPLCTITGPPPYPGPSNDTLCIGQQYVFTTIGGMSAYKWDTPANGTINGSATGSSVTITVNSGGFLFVRDTVTDANGCKSSCSYLRPVQESPTCSVNGPLTTCGGSTGNVYSVTTNGQIYHWSISGNGTITSATNGPSVTVTAGASGTYTVTVVTQFFFNTCGSECSQTVTVNPSPAPACPANQTACPNDPAFALSGGSPAGGSYSGPGVSAGMFNPAIAGPGTHTISYTVTDQNNCPSTCTFSITVSQPPAVNITSSSSYCMSDPGPVIGLTSSALGVTYQLKDNNNNNLGAPVAGTGGPIYFGTYPNGTYKVVANQGNCSNEAMAIVNAIGGVCAVDVPNHCSCDGPNGYADVTVKVAAPAGQNWTVKNVIGLYGPANPYPQITVGTPLSYIGGNMYTLDAARSNTKGFWVRVTNGFTDLDIAVGVASW